MKNCARSILALIIKFALQPYSSLRLHVKKDHDLHRTFKDTARKIVAYIDAHHAYRHCRRSYWVRARLQRVYRGRTVLDRVIAGISAVFWRWRTGLCACRRCICYGTTCQGQWPGAKNRSSYCYFSPSLLVIWYCSARSQITILDVGRVSDSDRTISVILGSHRHPARKVTN